jgi:rod shape-determining protein MreD
MKWPVFIAMAVLCVVLQTTIAPRLAVGRIRPDWILVLVVFFAMHVRGQDVLATGCLLGLLADLQSIERFGVLALAYTAAAGVVYYLRDHVFRAHPLAHLAVTFGAGYVVQLILLLAAWLFTGVGGGAWSSQVFGGLLIAMYSALWAPLIHAVLLRLSPWVGIDVPRYSHSRMPRLI